jgi:uncharacterized phage-associated protein
MKKLSVLAAMIGPMYKVGRRHAIRRRVGGAGAPYAGAMAVSAHDVAAVLRERMPGLPTKKLHKLLYYCQGHHLATFGRPLFAETISAWDMGPVVGQLWFQEKAGHLPMVASPLREAELNTVGYVLSRYGALTGRDLEVLTHNESPWQRADEHREPHGRITIEPEWIAEYFASDDSATDEARPALPAAAVRGWLRDAEARKADELHEDDLGRLRARLTQCG